MFSIEQFNSRETLDTELANKVASILTEAVEKNGKASIAVSGGSTPKGFFSVLSKMPLPWKNITVTLADERWVDHQDSASNTKLVHENLLQNEAANAQFFHIKQGDELSADVLAQLNQQAEDILPFDVLILGMGEDGHTASLFPCSKELAAGLAIDAAPLLKVVPTTAPHDRISFSFAYLQQSKNTFLHLCGDNKMQVLEKAINGANEMEMPIRAFLHHPSINTNVIWAE